MALSDPDDSNGDGISGRPQYIPDRINGGLALGRFGFRASHPTVKQQSAAAAFGDMGVTNSIFTDETGSQELSEEDLDDLSLYQELAGVPIARDQSDPEVQRGAELFTSVGCADCHVTTFTTVNTVHPELNGQLIHPFTDLLLHDMGPELSDGRNEFSASGSEWRTTPLWGGGFFKSVSGVKQKLLHDGRARSIEEAILWHGGEGETSTNNFKNLPKADRDALLRFLDSI